MHRYTCTCISGNDMVVEFSESTGFTDSDSAVCIQYNRYDILQLLVVICTVLVAVSYSRVDDS